MGRSQPLSSPDRPCAATPLILDTSIQPDQYHGNPMDQRGDTYHTSRIGSYGRSVSPAVEAEARFDSAPNDFLLPVRSPCQRIIGRQMWSMLTSLDILDSFLEAVPDFGVVHSVDILVCKPFSYLGNRFVFHRQSNIPPREFLSMIRVLVR